MKQIIKSKPLKKDSVKSSNTFFRFWLFIMTLSLIPIAWHLYDIIDNKAWGRVIVGITNQINGMAGLWFALRKNKITMR